MGLFKELQQQGTQQGTQPASTGGIFSQIAQEQNKPKEPGFLGKTVDTLARPFSEIGGEILQRTVGSVLPKGSMTPKTVGTGSDVNRITSGKQLAGDIIEGASWLPVGSGIKLLRGGSTLGSKVIQGAGLGGISGSMQGFGSGLAEGQSLGEATEQGLKTGVYGSVFGGTLPVLGKVASEIPKIARKGTGKYASDIAEQSAKKEIDQLFTNTRSISNAEQLALKKGVNLREKLADPQVFKGLKVENSRINPDDAIDVVEGRISSLLDSKGKMLPEIDRISPSVPRATLRQRAISEIEGQYTPADEADMIRAINNQINALPDLIKPSEMDKLRARFRASARNAKGLQKSSSEYSALENAARDIVFDITDNLPVPNASEYKAMNDYIRSMIETKQFLHKTLRAQPVKGGRLGKITGRMIGAIAGSQGGVLGTVLGSEAGGAIADVLTNNSLGSSVKARLIRGMTDDPAILKIADDLAEQAKRMEVPRLPSPTTGFRTQFGSGKTIPLGKSQTKADISGKNLYKQYEQVPRLQLPAGNPQSPPSGLPVIQSRSSRSDRAFGFPGSNANISRQNTAKMMTNTVDTTPIPDTLAPNGKPSSGQLKKKLGEQGGKSAFGVMAGFETDENGKPRFNPEKATMGALAIGALGSKGGQKALDAIYKETGVLTTKILKKLEGKSTVSKQFISDLTNSGDLKQTERDVIRQALEGEGNTINVPQFANKVKAELLPLKVTDSFKKFGESGRYENITLPDELRGKVSNYKERIYESPIKTSAGNVHFGSGASINGVKGTPEGYFGHTRIEDMADNKTRRVIEVQSDLYQKGNLEKEGYNPLSGTPKDFLSDAEYKRYEDYMYEGKRNLPKEKVDDFMSLESKIKEGKAGLNDKRATELSKLQQYNDPTAHFRMIREEIKKAAEDGKTKLQFPTGETAMKIEGLGETPNWRRIYDLDGRRISDKLEIGDLKTGETVNQAGQDWIVTDVLGDGKFKAVPKEKLDDGMQRGKMFGYSEKMNENEQAVWDRVKFNYAEEFDISGKVDTSNPIYKFYNKEVRNYLNKFGGKEVVDDKGVSWIEVPITKAHKSPVEAFSMAPLGLSGLPLLGQKLPNRKEDEQPYLSPQRGMAEKTYRIPSRKVQITEDDLRELGAILFGEVSNRPNEKKLLEARTIANIALNRAEKEGKTLKEVLTAPKQFQAYGGNQYQSFKTGNTDALSKEKVDAVNKILDEIRRGMLINNAGKNLAYAHLKDNSIRMYKDWNEQKADLNNMK